DLSGIAGSLHYLTDKESSALAPQSGMKNRLAVCLMVFGELQWKLGDYATARSFWEDALTLHHELGDKRGRAWVLNHLRDTAYVQGDHAEARLLYEEALSIYRELGDRRGIAGSLICLGYVASIQGDYASMQPLYEESLSIHSALEDRAGVAWSL